MTTPTVVKYFSYADSDDERYVLFAENDRRYFPRYLKIRTLYYENPFDEFLIELLESGFLEAVKTNQLPSEQLTLFDIDEFHDAVRNPLFESQLVHQFCSSPAKVKDFCDSVRQSKYKMDFAKQNELIALIDDYQDYIDACLTKYNDPKLQQLLDIIRQADGDKVVVFCIYKETAKTLREHIQDHFKGITVETTLDRKKVDLILQRFAPIANEVPEDLHLDPLQVLIATSAYSEGFNLQDAAILVNYDLPWTVLQLAQRMGRILRPWHKPREITIYNLIPSTMHDERLHMAMNWQDRLINYSEEYRSFADIPVLLQSGERNKKLEMIDLAQELQHFTEVDLDLDQVMEFVENAERLYTTSFYDDLAKISLDVAEEIQSLPLGIRTARIIQDEERLFILFKYRGRYFPALFDNRSKLLEDHKNPDAIMKIIRCEENTLRAPFEVYPRDNDFDEWIENSKLNWAGERNIQNASINEVQIVCVMALVSG